MNQRTDFWEDLEKRWAQLGKVKRALSPDEVQNCMSKPGEPPCTEEQLSIGAIPGEIVAKALSEELRTGLHQGLKRTVNV